MRGGGGGNLAFHEKQNGLFSVHEKKNPRYFVYHWNMQN